MFADMLACEIVSVFSQDGRGEISDALLEASILSAG
jgi:hypothetical protein